MPFPCAKTIPKSDQISPFSIFRLRKSFERNGAPFAGELTRRFSLPRPTHVLSISSPKTTSRPCVGLKKVVNGAFPTIFNPEEVRVNEKNE